MKKNNSRQYRFLIFLLLLQLCLQGAGQNDQQGSPNPSPVPAAQQQDQSSVNSTGKHRWLLSGTAGVVDNGFLFDVTFQYSPLPHFYVAAGATRIGRQSRNKPSDFEPGLLDGLSFGVSTAETAKTLNLLFGIQTVAAGKKASLAFEAGISAGSCELAEFTPRTNTGGSFDFGGNYSVRKESSFTRGLELRGKVRWRLGKSFGIGTGVAGRISNNYPFIGILFSMNFG